MTLPLIGLIIAIFYLFYLLIGFMIESSVEYKMGKVFFTLILMFIYISLGNWFLISLWGFNFLIQIINLCFGSNGEIEDQHISTEKVPDFDIPVVVQPEPTPTITPVRPRRRRETIAVEIVDQNAAAVKKLCPYCGTKPEDKDQVLCHKCGGSINS